MQYVKQFVDFARQYTKDLRTIATSPDHGGELEVAMRNGSVAAGSSMTPNQLALRAKLQWPLVSGQIEKIRRMLEDLHGAAIDETGTFETQALAIRFAVEALDEVRVEAEQMAAQRDAPANAVRRRGRPRDTDATNDAQVAAAWATGIFATYADLARELGRDAGDVKAAVDRHRKRAGKAVNTP